MSINCQCVQRYLCFCRCPKAWVLLFCVLAFRHLPSSPFSFFFFFRSFFPLLFREDMAPSAKIRHRFQNSLDIVAARSLSYVDLTQPSGTDNVWSIVDSPTLGRAGTIDSPTLGRLSKINSPALGNADMIDSPILGRMSGIARRLEWLAAEPSPVLPTIVRSLKFRAYCVF